MTLITFPQKLCAMCGRRAAEAIDLVDEDGENAGQKFLCDDYPYCKEPGLVDTE